jgi:alkylmercury lyase
MATATPTGLAAELAAATPTFDEDEQRLALALYRLLADGEPVEHAALAARIGVPLEQVSEFLGRWPGVYTDASDRITGFWGLSIEPTAHRLLVDDCVLYAWCAWDTLFLPELLATPAEVQSRCPTTGEPISLTVTGTDITDVQPTGAVLSFLHRDKPFDADPIRAFCHYVHFFATPAAADAWTARHDETFTISLADGIEIARLTNRARYPSILTP